MESQNDETKSQPPEHDLFFSQFPGPIIPFESRDPNVRLDTSPKWHDQEEKGIIIYN